FRPGEQCRYWHDHGPSPRSADPAQGQSGGPGNPRGHAGGKNAAGLSAYAAIAGENERPEDRADLPTGWLDAIPGRSRLSRQDRWSARRQRCQPALTGWRGSNAIRSVETPRVHHAARWRGGRVATRGAQQPSDPNVTSSQQVHYGKTVTSQPSLSTRISTRELLFQ